MRPAPIARLALSCAVASAVGTGGCRTPQEVRRGGPRGLAPISQAAPASESVLANGVRVVVEENHVTPLVAVAVWVDVGAADDPPALSGAAHLFEHLLLRGSKRRPGGAGAREIEAVGGTFGAWTGLDETVYYALVPAPFLATALDALADALAGPSLDPADIERARTAVLDEIRSVGADPVRRASEALYATAFAGHGYAHPVLGTTTAVAALTPAALAARSASVHVGSAITVVVVGDVGPDAGAAVARAFGAIPRGNVAVRERGALPHAPARVALARSTGSDAAIVLGFRTSPLDPEHAAAADLLAAMLGRAGASRLENELVRNRPLAVSVRASTFNSRDGGLVTFVLTTSPRRVAELAEAATDIILRVGREAPDVDEVEAARTGVDGDLARGEGGPLGRARRLAFATTISGGADAVRRYREQLASLGPTELQSAAGKLLRAEALTVAVALPESTTAGKADVGATLKPRLEAMIAGAAARADRGPATPVAPAPTRPGEPVRFVSGSGARVLVLQDPGAPLVSVTAAFLTRGGAAEPAADGPAALIAALLDRGTRTRSAPDIRSRMQSMAGRLTGFTTADAFGLRAEFLPRDVDQGLTTLADCLLRPSFPEEDLDLEKRALIGRLKARTASDVDRRHAWRLFQRSLQSDRTRAADADSLPGVTRLRLLDHYRRHHPLSGLAIAIVGDVDPARAIAVLAPELAAGPDGSVPASALLPPTAPPEPPRSEASVVARATATVGAEAVVGYPTFGPADPDRVVMEVAAELLAGREGRLAVALRQDTAGTLGCRASGRAATGVEPGYLAITLSCPPGRLDAAIAVARAELTRLATEAAPADEVSRTARRLGGARALALGTRAAVADALALDEARGLAPLAHRQHAAALLRVGAADVTRAARRAVDPKREVVSVVAGAGT